MTLDGAQKGGEPARTRPSHEPPPAAAARTRKDVDGEHPAQQRRPLRRTLTRRSHRRRGALLLSLGAPRNHRRPPRRVRREHPVKAQIAETFYYLHTQDKSCWTHELQLTPFATKPSV